jgi:hypothetical protein
MGSKRLVREESRHGEVTDTQWSTWTSITTSILLDTDNLVCSTPPYQSCVYPNSCTKISLRNQPA